MRFRYAFQADDEGTHFYHSHSGHQKANGIFGALIVRAPPSTLSNRHLYDFDLPEHLIIASDWMHHLAEEDFPGMISRSLLTESMLINGHGRYFNVGQYATFCNYLKFFSLDNDRDLSVCTLDRVSCRAQQAISLSIH